MYASVNIHARRLYNRTFANFLLCIVHFPYLTILQLTILDYNRFYQKQKSLYCNDMGLKNCMNQQLKRDL